MMGRGQYDRAAAKVARLSRQAQAEVLKPVVDHVETLIAAKAKRTPAETEAMLDHMADVHLPPAPQFARPGWPYLNTPGNLLELQAKLDAANALLDRYKDLVKRNGLWLDE